MSKNKCHCSNCPKVVKPKHTHHGKQSKKGNEEHLMYYNSANILGYKYDYLFPSLTVNAGGYHFQ